MFPPFWPPLPGPKRQYNEPYFGVSICGNKAFIRVIGAIDKSYAKNILIFQNLPNRIVEIFLNNLRIWP